MANKIRFNYELLKNIIEENNIELLEDYSKYEIINRETKIKGICTNAGCKKEFNKRFESFYNTKSLCNECVKKNKIESLRKTMIEICKNKVVANQEISYKYNLESLNNYTKENNIDLLEDYSKYDTVRKDTKIKGKCKGENCKNIFEKGFRELRTKGSPYCIDCTYKNTFIRHEKNGTHYNFMSNEKKEKIRNKIKQSNLNKSHEEREEINNKIIKKYNKKSDEEKKLIIQKRVITNKNLYNYEYYLQNIDNIKNMKENLINKTEEEKIMIKKKKLETNLIKYGVEYPTQNPEIMEKISKNCYKSKTFISKSGKEYICQGYEPYALKILTEEMDIKDENIITGVTNVPKIKYFDKEEVEHIHYPDIYLNNQNKLIEVKSTWTLKKKTDLLFAKQKAAKEQGYLYEIWVISPKGKIIEKHD